MFSQYVILTDDDCQSWQICEDLEEGEGEKRLRLLCRTDDLKIARLVAASMNFTASILACQSCKKEISIKFFPPDGVGELAS